LEHQPNLFSLQVTKILVSLSQCDGFLTANTDVGTSSQQHKKKKRKIKALTTDDDPSGPTAILAINISYLQV